MCSARHGTRCPFWGTAAMQHGENYDIRASQTCSVARPVQHRRNSEPRRRNEALAGLEVSTAPVIIRMACLAAAAAAAALVVVVDASELLM